MAYYKDRIGQTVSVGGTGALTISTAVAKHRALVVGDDARLFPYVIEDGDAWETGYGTYTHTGTSFARTTRTDSSTGAALNVTTAAKVYVTWIADQGTQFSHVSETHVSGLKLAWVSTSAINIEPGAAYVQSVQGIVRVTATINLTSLSLGNSAWGYVYLKNDGTAECNTTAPAAAYAGLARSKASDTSRRFLGEVKTDTSGNIILFQHDPASGLMVYREKTSSTFRVLSAGAATSKTAIDCSIAIPATARMGFGRLTNLGSVSVYFGSNEDAVDTSTLNYAAISPGAQGFFPFPLDSNQDAAYLHTGAGGSAYFDVYGYYNVR